MFCTPPQHGNSTRARARAPGRGPSSPPRRDPGPAGPQRVRARAPLLFPRPSRVPFGRAPPPPKRAPRADVRRRPPCGGASASPRGGAVLPWSEKDARVGAAGCDQHWASVVARLYSPLAFSSGGVWLAAARRADPHHRPPRLAFTCVCSARFYEFPARPRRIRTRAAPVAARRPLSPSLPGAGAGTPPLPAPRAR